LGRATTIKSSAATRSSAASSASDTPSRRHDVAGIVALAFTVLCALALASYDAATGANWIGAVGHGLANLLTMGFGLAAWVIPLELASFTVRVFALRPSPLGAANAAATLVLLLVGCALVHLSFPGLTVFGGQLPGGMIGEVFGELLRSLFGPVGAYVVGLAVLLARSCCAPRCASPR
jgi:S-DNA-T family DNA segregation ATPase FtsK/SpoIIIE